MTNFCCLKVWSKPSLLHMFIHWWLPATGALPPASNTPWHALVSQVSVSMPTNNPYDSLQIVSELCSNSNLLRTSSTFIHTKPYKLTVNFIYICYIYIYITSYHSPKSLWLPFIQLHQAIFKGHTVTQSHIFPKKTSKMEEFPIDLRLTKSDSPTNSQPFRSSGTASAKGFSSLLLLAVSLALVQPPDVGFQISTLWLFNIAMV